VPYQNLRESLKNHENTKELIKKAQKSNLYVYISFIDSDTINFNGIYSSYLENYYYGNNTAYDIFQRGYIFSVTNTSTPQNMTYDTFTMSQSSKFLVGAPYHFYFGLIPLFEQ
jgi:hypothetical protein